MTDIETTAESEKALKEMAEDMMLGALLKKVVSPDNNDCMMFLYRTLEQKLKDQLN